MTSATLWISKVSQPPAELERLAQERHKDADLRFEPESSLTGVAFDVLLEVVRAGAPKLRGRDTEDRTSPSQMFKPDPSGARERRQAVLKEEYRSGTDRFSDNRLASTAGEERRPLSAGRAGNPAAQSAVKRASEVGVDGAGVRLSVNFDTARGGNTRESLISDRRIAYMLHNVGASAAARTAGHAGPFPGAAALPSEVGGMAAVTGQTTMPTARATGTSTGSQLPAPAQQVAALLGAGRGGEIEATRPATLSPPTADMRHPELNQKGAERPATQETNEARFSSIRNGGDQGGIAGPGRTLFDRLVRSIHLNGGARRSSARMWLEPPELGRVHVDVRVEGERLSIDVRTETLAARDLVSQRASQLTAALEHHGIHVDRFEVITDAPEDRPPSAHDGNEAADDARNQAAADDNRDGQWTRSPWGAQYAPSEHSRLSFASDTEPDRLSRVRPMTVVAQGRLDIRV